MIRQASVGTLHGGLPFRRSGDGPRVLVVLQGLTFEHKAPPRWAAAFGPTSYGFLGDDFTVYVVDRRPGLAVGSTMTDIAADYAVAIRAEFDPPVDVLGVSTGGSVALYLAADHPDVVRRLVIHSSACRLGDEARALQMRWARLAERGRRLQIAREMLGTVLPANAPGRATAALVAIPFAATAPRHPHDMVATIEAEDRHDFEARLGEIRAPTLVVAGTADPYYPVDLLRRTAEGIPGARLVLYQGQGHPARGERFARDVLAFLREPTSAGDSTPAPTG